MRERNRVLLLRFIIRDEITPKYCTVILIRDKISIANG